MKNLVVALASLLALAGCTAAPAAQPTTMPSPSVPSDGFYTAQAAAPATDTTAASEATTETTTEAPAYAPEAKDFAITLKVVKKQCFGSAGCLVTVNPDLAHVGGQDVPDSGTISVTYHVDGCKDAYTDTLEVTAGQYPSSDVMLQTKASDTKLAAIVESVEYRP